MNKFLKLFKINFRQNLKVFISYSIISLIALAVFFIISKFSIDSAVKYSVSSSIELASDIGYWVNMFTVLQMLIFVAFLFTIIHTRFSDYYGSTYTLMQLPINRCFHILSIILESSVYLIIQYAFLYILVKADYSYLINTFSRIENMHLFKVLDGFRENSSVFAFGYQAPIWNLSLKNIIYRLLICWPAISLYILAAYMGIYKFGAKAVVVFIAAFFALISLTNISGVISEIADTVIRYIFEAVFKEPSIKNILNSIVILIALGFSDLYVLRKKIDF